MFLKYYFSNEHIAAYATRVGNAKKKHLTPHGFVTERAYTKLDSYELNLEDQLNNEKKNFSHYIFRQCSRKRP